MFLKKKKTKISENQQNSKPLKVYRNMQEKKTKVYHVSKRKDGKWQIKFVGGEKAIKLFDTQVEAIEYSKTISDRQNGVYLVHNSKGKNKGRINNK